jgi:hypothetical protein
MRSLHHHRGHIQITLQLAMLRQCLPNHGPWTMVTIASCLEMHLTGYFQLAFVSLWCRVKWLGKLRLKCDGTRAETRFRLSAKRTSPFKSAGAPVQLPTGSRSVRISGGNAGYNMFRDSVKSTGYPLHSPVSPSLPLPCHHILTGLYRDHCRPIARGWELAEYQRKNADQPAKKRTIPSHIQVLALLKRSGWQQDTFSKMCVHARCSAKRYRPHYEVNAFIVWSWEGGFVCLCIHKIYTQSKSALYTYINVHRREPALDATAPTVFMVWPRAWTSGRLLWTQ